MSVELLNHQIIIDYLDANVSKLKSVAGAAGLAAATADLKQPPAAFVVPMSDRAAGNHTGTMSVTQLNTVRFAVIIAVQNLRDPRGEKAQSDLLVLRRDVMNSLHGWQPDSPFIPIEYGGGRLLRMSNQVLWWQDEFLTSHFIRSV